MLFAGARQREDGQFFLALWQAWHIGQFVHEALVAVQPKSRRRYPEWKAVERKWRDSQARPSQAPAASQPAATDWQFQKARMKALADRQRLEGEKAKRT